MLNVPITALRIVKLAAILVVLKVALAVLQLVVVIVLAVVKEIALQFVVVVVGAVVQDLVLAVVHKVALEDVDLELVPLNYKKKDPLFREGHLFLFIHPYQ